MNPIKLYEENKVIAGFSLLNLLFKQGGCNQVKTAVQNLLSLYNQKKIKPVVDSLWALEEVRDGAFKSNQIFFQLMKYINISYSCTPLVRCLD